MAGPLWVLAAISVDAGKVLKAHWTGSCLRLEDGPRPGYAVREALRESTNGTFDLGTGTIYPALHRLEYAGLITGQWARDSGRRRRVYRVTPTGPLGLKDTRSSWQRFSTGVSCALATSWPSIP